MKLRTASFSILLLTFLTGTRNVTAAQQTKRPFRVSDDIGMTLFHVIGIGGEIRFSPDGKYFAVWTERGRLHLNLVEDSLRFYRSGDVKNFVEHLDGSRVPSPMWIVDRSGKEGPVINDWRWLSDSSGVAFLEGPGFFGDKQLVLADCRTKKIEALTSTRDTVEDFDIRDRQHYVYAVADPAPLQRLHEESHRPAIIGTGRSFAELLFPDDPITGWILGSSRRLLWAVVDGKRFEVKANGIPLVVSDGRFALSPNGQYLVAMQVVSDVPLSWERLYPPPFPSDPYRIHAGHQDQQSGRDSVRWYVQIQLQTGTVQPLTDAPYGFPGAWETGGGPSWSNDGQAILLPGTFLKSDQNSPSRPCVAVVDLPSHTHTCVELLKGTTEAGVEEGYHFVKDVRFIGGDKHRVMVSFTSYPTHHAGSTEYENTTADSWQVVRQDEGEPEVGNNGPEIKVEEGLARPPLLVATGKGISPVIWDPNPQLENIDLAQVSVYKWKDKEGREWKGGLYKPSNAEPGQRFPLVIQTHGFQESSFSPSGFYATANAARELATAGIVVLQVDEAGCAGASPLEGPCVVSGYEAGAEQLVSEGLVDPERIGIVGFSRTCFYVMEMLTTSSLPIKAASVTDGQMITYLQYMLTVGYEESIIPRQFDAVIGAQPFANGLQEWMKRSPGFNLDKVTAPLLVVAAGPLTLLSLMWEPYAGLRSLHKPVDLMMLSMGKGALPYEHVLTNPGFRMASQGGSVDWFRFWLQDYEDPDLAKAEQYKRWRELRQMQDESAKKKLSAH